MKNKVENEVGKLAPDLFLFFKKALHGVKTSDFSIFFDSPQLDIQ